MKLSGFKTSAQWQDESGEDINSLASQTDEPHHSLQISGSLCCILQHVSDGRILATPGVCLCVS